MLDTKMTKLYMMYHCLFVINHMDIIIDIQHEMKRWIIKLRYHIVYQCHYCHEWYQFRWFLMTLRCQSNHQRRCDNIHCLHYFAKRQSICHYCEGIYRRKN